ncbi:phosphate acyltransferase [Lutispora saccharofermentans]|uniref:Phosphate butyryltransferase n=1 Tax=Lutispora saccharofermentans TaxID=3024236 RepID=A0ABT1NIM8_9FIRM|nr:phosphate acyltransferase [Lutispora saccharofermentans]MCQ1530434.1 phosphate butyryltransferase [Lutispora saccharofermentans]
MVYKNFNELITHVKSSAIAKRVVVAAAQDEHTLDAVLKVRDEGVVEPVLVGDRAKILEILEKLNAVVPDEDIYDALQFSEAAALSVSLVRNGKADFIMKGKLETADILKAVVNKETGLGMGRTMSHIAINQIPSYHKLLITTDGGMLLAPTLEQKRDVVINAVSALRSMGYDKPKVGILAASEKINHKLQDSVDAAALKEMNQNGEIEGCIVEGPISFDIAMIKERAVTKGYDSPCAGDVDVLVVPNITAGNILGKSLVEMAGAKMAGLIIGAKCPIVVTSRGSSAEEKYLALNLAAAMTK